MRSFIKGILPAITPLISKAAGSALRKVQDKLGADHPVSQISDAYVEQVIAEDGEIQAALVRDLEERRDFFLDFFGRATEVSERINTIRALVRPTVTWMLTGSVIALAFTGRLAGEVVKDAMLIALGFYFASREHQRA